MGPGSKLAPGPSPCLELLLPAWMKGSPLFPSLWHSRVPGLTWEGDKCVLMGGRHQGREQLPSSSSCQAVFGAASAWLCGQEGLGLCWMIPKHIFSPAERCHMHTHAAGTHWNWQAGKITASSGKREAPVSVPPSPLLAVVLHISSSQAAAPESRGGR